MKFTASLKAQKSEEKTYEIIKAGLIFETATGFNLSLILISLSGFIASTVFNRPESAPLIAIASATVFAGDLANCGAVNVRGLWKDGAK